MLDVDHSLPEILLYGKWMAVLLLLAWAARRGGGPLCTALAVTFLIILVDDGFRIHERGGEVLSEALRLEGVLGLRPRDVGELIVWAGLGTAVLLNLTVGFAMATPGERLAARPMLLTFAALLVAGIGVDMAHVLVAGTVANHPLEKPVNVLMVLLEDGAELLLGTVAVWLAMRQGFAASVPAQGHC
ncbi:hypothetical protein [Hyphomicrobium sp.]|uniref:hypothetical protein n=1 Tax=Hyphomicrobium sp. TaxID=82 RepID=UPI0025BD1530|nr:hypothetical protein [Hyphomicrobium sp.]MCC7253049.1 hypothetical protein [Hyphomicrobium sp.]